MNSCEVCLSGCTSVCCSCLCSCVGLEYSNCLDLIEKSNENLKDSEDSLKHSNICLGVCSNDHYNCKICFAYKCCCLGNKLNLNHLSHQNCSKNFQTSKGHKEINDFINYSNKTSKWAADYNRKENDFKMKRSYSDQLYFELDNNFKHLFNYFLNDEYGCSDVQSLFRLRRNFELSLGEVRYLEYTKNYDQESTDQLCFKLDQKLNQSLRRYSKWYKEDPKFNEINLSKFEFFVYFSLLHCNKVLKEIENLYPESTCKIKNLVIFVDKRRYPVDNLIKPELKHCLNNQIDSLQLNSNLKIRKLFPFRLNDLSFRFLTFLILDLNNDLFEPVQLQLNNLIALKHLEIYGKKFKFRKSRSFNTSLTTLIVHDKLLKNLCILELFPNLVIVKIQHSSGDILKPNQMQNFFKFKDACCQTEIRVVSLLNLSFNDFIFIIHHCKKIEYLECNLIYNQIPGGLKFLPDLKFVLFNLRSEQYKLGKTLTELIYSNLSDLGYDKYFYSNKFYCPKHFNLVDEPCFKTNCVNCKIYERLPKKKTSNLAHKNAINKFKAFENDLLDFLNYNYSRIKMNASKNKSLKKLSKSLNDLSNLGKPVIKNFEKLSRFMTLSKSRSDLNEIEQLNKLKDKMKSDYYSLYKKSRIRGEIRHCMIYLDGIRLCNLNLNKFDKVVCKVNHLKISELNKLSNVFNDLEMMKEKFYSSKTIELDETLSEKLKSIKLSFLISNVTSLVISKIDYLTLDYLIEQIKFIRTIELKGIQVDKKMSNYLEVKMHNVFKRLESFEFNCKDEEIDVHETSIKYLLNCNSLNKLKLKNIYINNDYLFQVLIRNVYCSNLELSYPLTKLDQRKLVEIMSFNALINKNLDYRIKFERNRFLDFNDLLPNFSVIG